MSFGVPPLLNQVASVANTATLLIADAALIYQIFKRPVWGLYYNGQPIIVPDSIVALELRNDSLISDYPQEQGAFQSYNKVLTPFTIRLRMTKGGTVAERSQFLADVAAILNDLNLYQVVTPEVSYSSVNIVHFEYARTSRNGLGLLVIELWLRQVRVTATAAFSNTKAPDGAAQSSIGTVQPQAATSAQTAAAAGFQ